MLRQYETFAKHPSLKKTVVVVHIFT